MDVQGYPEEYLDAGELSRFYSLCLKEELKIALLLDGAQTLKELLDEVGLNLHAHWIISDGKSGCACGAGPAGLRWNTISGGGGGYRSRR